jgi:hypothetical protein
VAALCCGVLCCAVLSCRKNVAVAAKDWVEQLEGTMDALERLTVLDAWLAHTGRQMQVDGLFRGAGQCLGDRPVP